MGMLDLIKNAVKFKPYAERKAKCPKCKAELKLGMERCPQCGTHVESMFRLECPKCNEANPLRSEKCSKCGYSFAAEQAPDKPKYRCPICGYSADYFMLSCPACGVKFVS